MLTFKQFLVELGTANYKKEGKVQIYTGQKPSIQVLKKKPGVLNKPTVPKTKKNSSPIAGGLGRNRATKLTPDQRCVNLKIAAKRSGLAGDRARTRLKGVCKKRFSGRA